MHLSVFSVDWFVVVMLLASAVLAGFCLYVATVPIGYFRNAIKRRNAGSVADNHVVATDQAYRWAYFAMVMVIGVVVMACLHAYAEVVAYVGCSVMVGIVIGSLGVAYYKRRAPYAAYVAYLRTPKDGSKKGRYLPLAPQKVAKRSLFRLAR